MHSNRILIHDPYQSKIRQCTTSNIKKSKKQKATTLANLTNMIGSTYSNRSQNNLDFIKNEKFKLNEVISTPKQTPSIEKYKIIYIPVQTNDFTSSKLLKNKNIDDGVLEHMIFQSKISERSRNSYRQTKQEVRHNRRSKLNEDEDCEWNLGEIQIINKNSTIRQKKNQKFHPIFESFENFNGIVQTSKKKSNERNFTEQIQPPLTLKHSSKQTTSHHQLQNLEENDLIFCKSQKTIINQGQINKEYQIIPRERFTIGKPKRNKIFEIKQYNMIKSKFETHTQFNKTFTNSSTNTKSDKQQNQITNKTILKTHKKQQNNTLSRVIPIQTKLIDKKVIEKNYKILDEVDNKEKDQELLHGFQKKGIIYQSETIQGKDCLTEFMVELCLQ